MKKRFLCFMLGLAFLTNIVTISYAMDTRDENGFLNENSYQSNELYDTLVDVGFGDDKYAFFSNDNVVNCVFYKS